MSVVGSIFRFADKHETSRQFMDACGVYFGRKKPIKMPGSLRASYEMADKLKVGDEIRFDSKGQFVKTSTGEVLSINPPLASTLMACQAAGFTVKQEVSGRQLYRIITDGVNYEPFIDITATPEEGVPEGIRNESNQAYRSFIDQKSLSASQFIFSLIGTALFWTLVPLWAYYSGEFAEENLTHTKFLIALFLGSSFAHEMGHYVAAKRNGFGESSVNVGVGFPLLSVRWHGDSFNLRSIPVASYYTSAGYENAMRSLDDCSNEQLRKLLEVSKSGLTVSMALTIIFGAMYFGARATEVAGLGNYSLIQNIFEALMFNAIIFAGNNFPVQRSIIRTDGYDILRINRKLKQLH